MKSVMKHQFSQVPQVNIPRSSFDRSCGYKTSFDAGYLIPVYCDMAVPGDTFNLQMAGFSRMNTPVYPVMDNLHLSTQFFAVPIRLIWDNFQRFMGERDPDPDSSIDFEIPVQDVALPPLSTTGHLVGSLSDYLGIPTDVAGLEHSALFHRAYAAIWNAWYRDENLQDSITVDKDNGPDNPADYVLQRRGKRHDYFTSSLPWTQRGDAVEIPLGTTAPIQGVPAQTTEVASATDSTMRTLQIDGASGDELQATGNTGALANLFFTADSTKIGLETDLSNASGATINALRQSFQIQKLLERDARGGTRYTEIIKSHFGVISPDQRLQRPEYLGGGQSMINVTPVAKTNGTAGTGDIGALGAYAVSQFTNHGFTKSFTEHCIIIGLASVRADLTYQQGLNRMFSYSTRYDMYWPTLAQIGEQSVLNKEIYAQGTAGGTDDDDVFGYQERYAEMRYKPSQITGMLRSTYSSSLDSWHLSQEFSSLPALNSTFIEDNPPLDRVVATPAEHHFIFDAHFNIRCARPMPLYGVPGMIDHF